MFFLNVTQKREVTFVDIPKIHKNFFLRRGLTMMSTLNDDQLGEIYPTMFDELNCTFVIWR